MCIRDSAYRLSRNNTYSFADSDKVSVCKVGTIAFSAYSMLLTAV